jgi:hypothetical protein
VSSDARGTQDGVPNPDPTLDARTAAVHAGEYRLLASVESGMAEGYTRHRNDVGDQRSLLFRTLELAAVGCRRRAAHYEHLARVLQSYANAPSPDPDPVLQDLDKLDPLEEAQTERFLGGDLSASTGDPGVPAAS